MDPFLVKIFDVDFYMSSPIENLDVTFSKFRGTVVQQVPVLRIFGSTTEGKKICVHIHGVFPYFYLPYDGIEPANILMDKIAFNLDKAVNVSLGQASSQTQHIYKITLVSGIPFYGYHSSKHQFFKVFLYNPILLKRVNDLLFNEAILGKIYQPYETHLNFTLQFMIDYNLHGMSYIMLSKVKYRSESIIGVVEDEEPCITKVSSCELECDTMSEFILNPAEIESGKLAANPGIAALWEDEKLRRKDKFKDSLKSQYLSLNNMKNIQPTESHELFKNALHDRLKMIPQAQDNSFNQSVYPIENYKFKKLTNCSSIDHHSPYDSQSTSILNSSELDETMNDTLNLTLNEDVQDMIAVLRDLEKNIEEDSVLSQVSKQENEEEMEELDHDATLLDDTIKISDLCANEDNELNENCKDNTKVVKILQLDGNCSDDYDSIVEIQPQFSFKKEDLFFSNNNLRKNSRCMEMLNMGFQPKFRVSPAPRPYTFREGIRHLQLVNKFPTIQTDMNFEISEDTSQTTSTTFETLLEAQRRNEMIFSNSFNSVMENCSISENKLLEENIINKDCLLFLDGTNDSDTDEDTKKPKLKNVKQQKPIYSSLPITKKSSTSTAGELNLKLSSFPAQSNSKGFALPVLE